MTSYARHLAVLVPMLIVPACFGDGDNPSTLRTDDSEVEVDADTDADADTDTDTDADTDVYTAATIPELQEGLYALGSMVRIQRAVVVGEQLEAGFHIAQPGGGASHAGLWITATADQGSVIEGELVQATGQVAELASDFEPQQGDGSITSLVLDKPLESLGEEPVPDPVTVTLEALAADAEPYEGMLLELQAPTVSQGGIDRWWIGGSLEVCDLYHSSTALYGASFESIQGLLWYEQGRFVLCPRSADDLVGYNPLLTDCGEATCIDDLGPGDLLITEVMRDPEAVFDDLGEWIELGNTTDTAVDLRGLMLSDDDGEAFLVTRSVVVQPGGYAVLAASGDAASNGGVIAAWDYPYSSFTLSDGSDELVLAHSEVIFDRVVWDDSVTFPALAGASMTLDPDHLDADENDDGANWCAASTPYGDGDLGTPGSANPSCIE